MSVSRAAQTRKPVDSAPRHFLDLCDFEPGTLKALIAAARQRKKARDGFSRGAEDKDAPLTGKMLALVFEQPSTRTRISFDVGMQELGGRCIMLTGQEMQLGRGETIADTARVLSRYVDAIMIRTLGHDMLMELAGAASVPVINGLTKLSHPCQVMADVMTFEEKKGPISGRTVAWVGDANNVCASWVHAASRFDFTLTVASPESLAPKPALRKWAETRAGQGQLHHRSGRGGRGRGLRRHRHLGVDGRQGSQPAAQPAQALSGESRADGAGRARCAFSCIASRPIAAKRSPTRSSTVRNPWSSTKPKTGSTCRRRSSSGASGEGACLPLACGGFRTQIGS